MVVFQLCKAQIMCILVLAYIEIIYTREGRNLNRVTQASNCNRFFDASLSAANFAVLFDGITACTVNFTETVPRSVNLLMHFGMYLSYEIFIALIFWYWVNVTVGGPRGRWAKAACVLPSVVFACITAYYMPQVEFIQGEYMDYSMGAAVHVCFSVVAVYCVLTVGVIVVKRREIPKKKLRGLETTVIFIVIILSLQIIFPQALISCIAVVLIEISIYLDMENPSVHGLEHYHNEMIMGFATLVENKDDNTGGHIRRTSAYAELIAGTLRKNRKYKTVMTRDYLRNLIKAAPMHDIGKIGVSDEILQKPGKLTADEFEKMKEHTVNGGRIIKDTFGHLLEVEYESMAYQVARYHHEKWNGNGYPDGLAGEDIPLCARIMAVADVFDAVSSRRCYREAMPLEECYRIIENGRGTDFDPDVVDAFMSEREKIEEIYFSKIEQRQL